jgi:ATP-binding cassette subfamily B protein
MSVAEQLETPRGAPEPPRDALLDEEAFIESQITEPAKSRARLRPLLALAPYVARYKGRAILALISLTAAAITTLIVPVAVRRMIDMGFTPEGIAMINSYFSVMIAVVAVLACASASRYYLVMTIGERIVADLRRDVFAHLISLSPSFFDSARSGELVSRLTADTTQIKSAVGASVSIALRNLMLFFGAAAMMVITSPRLSGFVLLAIPIIVIPLVAFGRWVRPPLARPPRTRWPMPPPMPSEAGQRHPHRCRPSYAEERLATTPASPARSSRPIKARARSDHPRPRAADRLIVPSPSIFGSVVAVILWVGSRDVLVGHAISPGRLGQFLLYAAFAAGGLGALLSEVWGELSAACRRRRAAHRDSCASSRRHRRAGERLRALPLPARGDARLSDDVQLRLSDPAQCARSIDGVDAAGRFRARPSRSSAPPAPARARCSTLLLRFYDPKSGTISLDGVPIRQADPAEVRARIALVPQDSVVFAASARENIRFGRPDATDAEVERAADLAHATEFLRRLPGGFDAQLGERGVTLSGGQRQRIAIARAILRDAPLLLLDEATSALDAESETLVQTALEELMRHRTTLVIAHRLATVLSCDRILVMDQGKIVEQGTHTELVAAGGLYARLARLQFEGI